MSVEWYGEALQARINRAALRGVTRGAHSVHEEANRLILETPKTGRVYRRRGVTHRASAPGEPFASDTGATVQSGRVDIDADKVQGIVSWSTAYAAALEYGSENMEPRSFARPALHNKTNEIVADIAREVEKELSS